MKGHHKLSLEKQKQVSQTSCFFFFFKSTNQLAQQLEVIGFTNLFFYFAGLCMHMHACQGVYRYLGMCVETREQPWMPFLRCLVFWESLSLSGASQVGCLVSEPQASDTPSTQVHMHRIILGVFLSFSFCDEVSRGLNSGPHDCKASTLLSESLLQPCFAGFLQSTVVGKQDCCLIAETHANTFCQMWLGKSV